MLTILYEEESKIIKGAILGEITSWSDVKLKKAVLESMHEIPENIGSYKYDESKKIIFYVKELKNIIEADELQREQEEKLIQEKIRQIAIAELAAEGKITVATE